MNTPSRSDGNWGWRLRPGALTKDLAEKLAVLSAVSDRQPAIEAEVAQPEIAAEFAA
jgi:4-alpha-glucanotransferase